LLTSWGAPKTPAIGQAISKGSREDPYDAKPEYQQKLGGHATVQQDCSNGNMPSQGASRKRALPQSFKPVSRSGFMPPRARQDAALLNSPLSQPQLSSSHQAASSHGSQSLEICSTETKQPVPQAQLGRGPKPEPGLDQGLGLTPGSAAAVASDQGRQRRLPTVLARPGAVPSSSPADQGGQRRLSTVPCSSPAARPAADELHFPPAAAAGSQPARLCTVPDVFRNGAIEYAQAWLPAVYEELNLQ
jgi:hypothetical protein